jgi:hypothetical protein
VNNEKFSTCNKKLMYSTARVASNIDETAKQFDVRKDKACVNKSKKRLFYVSTSSGFISDDMGNIFCFNLQHNNN